MALYKKKVKVEAKSHIGYITLSNKGFGRLVNRSRYTGKNIQKALNKIGVIKSMRNVEILSTHKFDLRGFYSLGLTPNHFLNQRGYLCRRSSNKLSLCN